MGIRERVHVAITKKESCDGFFRRSFDVTAISCRTPNERRVYRIVSNNAQSHVLDNEVRTARSKSNVGLSQERSKLAPHSPAIRRVRAGICTSSLTESAVQTEQHRPEKEPRAGCPWWRFQDEMSAGSTEWRSDSASTAEHQSSFEFEDPRVFTGRIHLYNIEPSESHHRNRTSRQRNPARRKQHRYYRASDRSTPHPSLKKEIGTAKLIATNDLIRDSHWAFIKH